MVVIHQIAVAHLVVWLASMVPVPKPCPHCRCVDGGGHTRCMVCQNHPGRARPGEPYTPCRRCDGDPYPLCPVCGLQKKRIHLVEVAGIAVRAEPLLASARALMTDTTRIRVDLADRSVSLGRCAPVLEYVLSDHEEVVSFATYEVRQLPIPGLDRSRRPRRRRAS